MATEFNETHHRDIITIDLNGVPYSGWFVHCCPGDWNAIKEELGPLQPWLELRCGNCLVCLGEFTSTAVPLDTAGDRPSREDTFTIPRTDKDRPA